MTSFIIEAVNNGSLSMKDLDKAVRNVLTLIQKAEDGYALQQSGIKKNSMSLQAR